MRRMWRPCFHVLLVVLAAIPNETVEVQLNQAAPAKLSSSPQEIPVENFQNEEWRDRTTLESKSSVPRKGVEDFEVSVTEDTSIFEEKKGSSKPRKGAFLTPPSNKKLQVTSSLYISNSTISISEETHVTGKPTVLETTKDTEAILATSTTNAAVVKSKPTASIFEALNNEDEMTNSSYYSTLTIGLSLGIALILILALGSFWRLKNVWTRHEYKRVDFLIDGMYCDAWALGASMENRQWMNWVPPIASLSLSKYFLLLKYKWLFKPNEDCKFSLIL